MPVDDNEKGGDGKDGAADDVQQQLSTLQKEFEAAKGELDSLKGAKTDLEQRLEEADKELLSDEFLSFKEAKGRRASSKDGENEEIDLDRASNREIASFVEKKYKGDIDLAVKDIRKELDLSKQQIGMMAAQFDVALTAIRHDGKDGKTSFSEGKEKIFAIAKANPKWDAERCYQQFILESSAQREKDVEDKRKKAEEEEKAATERTGVPGSTVSGKQLSKEEAAELAYRKAFGKGE